jgi:uncharacterized protein
MKRLIASFIFLCLSAGCSKNCFIEGMNAKDLDECAKKGDATAQYNLGVIYEQGRYFPQDDKLAVEWYSKAAEQNNANAQYNLGLKYEQGKGVLQNIQKTLEFITKAAKQDHVVAQYKLGDMYRLGSSNIILKDDNKAFEWYSKAAKNNFATAQFMMGEIYRLGSNAVQKDQEKAFEWYSTAAEQGDANAQYRLGILYYKGEGQRKGNTDQDLLLSVMWLNLSAAQFNQEAIKLRSILLNKMTPDQIAESDKMTAAWLADHRR